MVFFHSSQRLRGHRLGIIRVKGRPIVLSRWRIMELRLYSVHHPEDLRGCSGQNKHSQEPGYHHPWLYVANDTAEGNGCAVEARSCFVLHCVLNCLNESVVNWVKLFRMPIPEYPGNLSVSINNKTHRCLVFTNVQPAKCASSSASAVEVAFVYIQWRLWRLCIRMMHWSTTSNPLLHTSQWDLSVYWQKYTQSTFHSLMCYALRLIRYLLMLLSLLNI